MTIIDYIQEFLEQTTISLPRDEGIHIGLPYPYVCASTGIFNRDQYYWDSYFIILGLVALGEIGLADYLPIDLNACLYKYETDLAAFYHELKQAKKERYYLQQAEKRKRMINALMWQEDQGFFFDYNYKKKQPSSFYSLAGFYPLWAKLASAEQAEKLRHKLSFFEYEGGLVTSQKKDIRKPQRQWDYPNGWANLHWIVIQGLLNYGYTGDAARIARKWLRLNEKVFAETGKLWEKYDVVKCTTGKSGHYKTQPGFGWTNMIYIKLQKMLLPLRT